MKICLKSLENRMSDIGGLTKKLEEDVSKADVWANGPVGASYTAKDGVKVLSIRTLSEKAEINTQIAEESAKKAEAAASAAQLGSGLYFTVSDGLSATTNGDLFNVVSSENSDFIVLYKNVNDVAVEVKRYPSSEYIVESNKQVKKEILDNPADQTRHVAWAVVDEKDNMPFAISDDGSILHSGITETVLDGATALAVVDEAGHLSMLMDSNGHVLFSDLHVHNLNVKNISFYQPTTYEKDGNIFIVVGSKQIKITYDGANSLPHYSGSNLMFLSSKRRSVLSEYFYQNNAVKRFYPDLLDKKFMHVLITGQSLAEGAANASITHTAMYPDQAWKFIGDSVAVNTQKSGVNLIPLHEAKYETIASGFGNKAITDGLNQQLIMSGQAWGGKPYNEIKKGGDAGVYEKCIEQVLASHNLPGKSFVPAVFVVHGEADGSLSNKEYDQNLRQWLDDFNHDIGEITNQYEPIIMITCQTSSVAGYKNSAKRDEFTTPFLQLKANNDNSDIFLVGPKYQYQYKDYAHILAEDTRHLGEMYAKVFKQVIEQGNDWQPLKPIAFSKANNEITIDFHVPVGALAFDTTTVKDPGNYGFNLMDASGVVINEVKIISKTQVKITCSANIPKGAVLSYAFHNGTDGKSGRAEGARGCLRDSDNSADLYGYMPLHNWCVIFKHEFN